MMILILALYVEPNRVIVGGSKSEINVFAPYTLKIQYCLPLPVFHIITA